MQARDIMTPDPGCCTPETNLQDVSRMMADHDCGEIPVLDEQGRPTGVVTDRDIVCRAVARGMDPARTTARDVMTLPVVTVTEDTPIAECLSRMEEYQIRRIPVVDANGRCVGIVAQADVARQGSDRETGELVRDVSRPSSQASGLPLT